MERVSEAVASAMGTVTFLIVSSSVILAWVFLNHVITFLGNSWTGLLDGKGFDPAPFILLNLVFSAVAFYTGALVIIAQKAQTRTDRANEMAGRSTGRNSLRTRPTCCRRTRSHRADPRSEREDDHPDRASPRGHLRAPIHHLIIRAIPVAVPIVSSR